MSVCRVVMADFVNEEEADKFLTHLSERGKELYQRAETMLVLKTTETSGMSVTVYPNEEAADQGTEIRKKLFSEWSGKIVQSTTLDAELIGYVKSGTLLRCI